MAPDFWDVSVWRTADVVAELGGRRPIAVASERIIGDERDAQSRAFQLRDQYGLDYVVTCNAGFYQDGPPVVACDDYRPDGNGECLNCDEPWDAHQR